MSREELPNWVPDKEAPAEIGQEMIEELRAPFEQILEQMSERIEAGDYGLIIGDDASGRIPTLILDKIIKYRHEQKGYPLPKTRFFAGARHPYTVPKTEAVQIMLEEEGLTAERVHRALIVTEVVSSGRTLEHIADALRKMGIPFDIATVGLTKFDYDRQNDIARVHNKLGNEHIYFGQEETPTIWRKSALSGVEKHHHQLHAQRAPSGVFPVTPQSVAGARADADKLARELTAWYQKELKQ